MFALCLFFSIRARTLENEKGIKNKQTFTMAECMRVALCCFLYEMCAFICVAARLSATQNFSHRSYEEPKKTGIHCGNRILNLFRLNGFHSISSSLDRLPMRTRTFSFFRCDLCMCTCNALRVTSFPFGPFGLLFVSIYVSSSTYSISAFRNLQQNKSFLTSRHTRTNKAEIKMIFQSTLDFGLSEHVKQIQLGWSLGFSTHIFIHAVNILLLLLFFVD